MPTIWTSIELAETEALALQARSGKGAPAVRRAVRIPLPAGPAEDAAGRSQARGQALAEGLKQAGLKVASAVLVAPKRFVTVRYAVLPSTDEGELGPMARFEAERHVPFNTERHLYSHHVMRKDGLSGSHVLMAAADAPDIEELLGLAKAAGFEVEAIDVSSLGQFNALAAAAPAGFAEETAALLHLGAQTTDISIVSRGLLIFTRSAPVGYERLASDLMDQGRQGATLSIQALRKIDMLHPSEGLRALGLSAQVSPAPGGSDLGQEPTHIASKSSSEFRVREWINRLAIEVQRSYEFASRELSCPPVSTLYLSGAAAKWPGFDAYLQASLNVELRRVQPFHGLETDRTLDAEARDDDGPYAGVVGALARYWRPGALAVDLRPSGYRARRVARRRRQAALTTAALTLAAIVLGSIYFHQLSMLRKERFSRLGEEVRKLAPRVEVLIDKEKQLNIINRYRLDKRSALAILDTISAYAYIPRNVALTEFKFEKGRVVNLTGYALSLEDLNRFIGDLENAAYQDEKIFKGGVVPIKREFGKTLDKRPQQLVVFQLACHIED